MLKQSKGIIYVQGKETKDATLIGLAYMDKVELKNKNMKTIEEVKEYFKDAKEVKCISTNKKANILNGVTKDIWKNKEDNDFWIDIKSHEGLNVMLYCERRGFAKIISYKENKPEFEHLEEIEVSDDGINWVDEKLFIGFNSKGNIVAEHKTSKNVIEWVYARKINHERNEAIQAIKEYMKVNNIKTNEL